MITATRYHDISAGHRVAGHESKCRFLHGHNYRIHFTIEGGLDDLGRVIDFGVIKSILCEWLETHWDHKFLIWVDDPLLFQLVAGVEYDNPEHSIGLEIVSFNPTAENMAEYLLNDVGPALLPSHVRLINVRVEETRKCSAEASIDTD